MPNTNRVDNVAPRSFTIHLIIVIVTQSSALSGNLYHLLYIVEALLTRAPFASPLMVLVHGCITSNSAQEDDGEE